MKSINSFQFDLNLIIFVRQYKKSFFSSFFCHYRTQPAHNLPAYHHSSFPKKYQQHRSPPTEYVQSPYRHHASSRTSNENNSHQYGNQQRNQQVNKK